MLVAIETQVDNRFHVPTLTPVELPDDEELQQVYAEIAPDNAKYYGNILVTPRDELYMDRAKIKDWLQELFPGQTVWISEHNIIHPLGVIFDSVCYGRYCSLYESATEGSLGYAVYFLNEGDARISRSPTNSRRLLMSYIRFRSLFVNNEETWEQLVTFINQTQDDE